MSKMTRPFDAKPAAQCLACGTDIAGGAYCLHCEPIGAHLGDTAWIRFRWFSGPRAEARRKKAIAIEYVNKAIVGAIAAMLALVLVGQWIGRDQDPLAASNYEGMRSHRIERALPGAKRPLDAVTIS